MVEMLLVGSKVRLRPKEWRDVNDDYKWARDPELSRLDATLPTTLTLDEYISGYADELRRPSQGRYRFAIDTLEGQHIGNCMYYDLDEMRGQTEVGILIGERAFWNQGHGSEAVCLLLEHIFTSTRVQRAYLHTLEWNIRAQKAFQKCGFVNRGSQPRAGQPFVMMDITRQEWQERQAKLRAAADSGPAGDYPGQPEGE